MQGEATETAHTQLEEWLRFETLLAGFIRVFTAPPGLAAHDDGHAFCKCGMELRKREVLFHFCVKAELAGNPHDVSDVGPGLRTGMEPLHQLLFFNILAPVTQNGLEG